MKNIAKSLAIIAGVAAIVTVGTIAFFSDTEKSVDNKFTAGTIDISVDGQNPWTTSWENYLDKPCETNYMTFTIKNVGKNPANIWKHIANVVNDGGANNYCEASSEPEYVEGGGTGTATNCIGNYVERDNLSAYMVYDMAICEKSASCACETENSGQGAPIEEGGCWQVLIPASNQIRVDNVACNWIPLGELGVDKKLVVSQSYHLTAWDNAGEPEITNWAQGDTMTFNVELEARQLSAPAPVAPNSGTLILENKDSTTWEPIADTTQATLTYNTSGPNFNYTLTATGLKNTADYCLIYYYDPWPGSGGFDVECDIETDGSGDITSHTGSEDIGSIPVSGDGNYPVGAKLWLIPESDYDPTNDRMTVWNHADYLFEMNLIKYTE